jgi:hypothetical protein
VATHAHQARQHGPEEVAGLNPATVAGVDLSAVRGLAKILDEAVTIPGTKTKIGLDAVLGLIPGIGDLGSAAIGGYILLAASKLGVPAVVLWRMLLNLAIDTVLGAIPFVGDLFDVAFRANAKNANLLVRSLAEPAETRRSSRWVVAAVGIAFLAITAVGLFVTYLLVRTLWHSAS